MNENMKAQIGAALAVAGTIGKAIRELGQVPSGVLYAQVCGVMSYTAYQGAVGLLKHAGVVTEQNHLLTWVGPQD